MCENPGVHGACNDAATVAATDGVIGDALVGRLVNPYRRAGWPLVVRSDFPHLGHWGCRPVRGILPWRDHCMQIATAQHGPPGVGKSTVGWALYSRSVESGRRTAYVDIDQLGMCYPASDADPDRDHLKATGLARVLDNFRAAGAQRCIVSGVLHPVAFPVYERVVCDHDVRMIRLTASHDALRQRLARRGGRNGAEVVDAIEEAVALDRAAFSHPTIDTEGRPADEVVEQVSTLIGRQDRPATRSTDSALYGPAQAAGRVVVVSGRPRSASPRSPGCSRTACAQRAACAGSPTCSSSAFSDPVRPTIRRRCAADPFEDVVVDTTDCAVTEVAAAISREGVDRVGS